VHCLLLLLLFVVVHGHDCLSNAAASVRSSKTCFAPAPCMLHLLWKPSNAQLFGSAQAQHSQAMSLPFFLYIL
jgi:hypothetical protein